MKKYLFLCILLAVGIHAQTQTDSILLSRKGQPVLPRKGDMVIGMGLNSTLNFLGNMFSQAGNNQYLAGMINGNSFFGKFMVSDHRAIRTMVSVNQLHQKIENPVPDDFNLGNKVTDQMNNNSYDYRLSLGIERRRGTGRMQLFYGPELIIRLNKQEKTYSYGNYFAPINLYPNTTYDFTNGYYAQSNERQLEFKRSNGLELGLRLFTGVEYFLFPGVAVGTEFGIGFSNSFGKQNILKSEYWDFSTNRVNTKEFQARVSQFNFTTDNLGGQVYLQIYFR